MTLHLTLNGPYTWHSFGGRITNDCRRPTRGIGWVKILIVHGLSNPPIPLSDNDMICILSSYYVKTTVNYHYFITHILSGNCLSYLGSSSTARMRTYPYCRDQIKNFFGCGSH